MGIGDREQLFDESECLLVAEIAQAHDGSLGTAHAYIDAVAKAGAHAVKFQTHIADAESTPDEPWRVRFSPQDETRFDYWKRMEFTLDQWRELYDHAREAGLLFISSPFSTEAVSLLESSGIDIYKVASGEISNIPLLRAIAETKKPAILSSGMSPYREIDRAIEVLRGQAPLAVLQCTSEYPCPPEMVGLNVLAELRYRYDLPVGLSDHSGAIYAGLAAATLGIAVLEVHVTMSRQLFGPDVPASVTIDELAALVEGIDFVQRAINSPVDKEAIAERFEGTRQTFMKSIVASRHLEAGTVLRVSDLALKKPGTGLSPDRLDSVIGTRLKTSVETDQQLSDDHLESAGAK